MKGLFWLGVGLAVGTAVSRRLARAAEQLTPAGVGANLSSGVRELAAAIGEFGADLRAGMSEREDELARMVDQCTGIRVGGRHRVESPGQVARSAVDGPGAATRAGIDGPVPRRRPTPCPTPRPTPHPGRARGAGE